MARTSGDEHLGNMFSEKTRQTMKFVLKRYDTELLSFDLWSEGLDGFVCFVPVTLQRIGKSSAGEK